MTRAIPRERPSGRRRRPGVLAVAALLLVPGCGLPHQERTGGAATSPPAAIPSTPPAPTATPRGGLPDPKAVDRQDATAVSRAAVQVMWTVDAATDRGQGDAYRRARPYLTPAYAARSEAQPAGAVPSVWRDHRAYARVRLAPQTPEDGVPPDNARTAHRQWDVTVTPIGRDGWKGPSTHAIAFVTLTRDAENAWWVSEVTTA
ncbi:hypothetical protein ACQPZP_34430 [Spirillospora sp. CA-142024]|uniref:hypothetical protein n=1 Tax=Spirillospora sp. CA-142024 TaxID=3240036 RepID=UPI003D8FAD2A